MKRLLHISFGATQVNVVLLILRAGIAGMMLVHGIPKMQMLIYGGADQFPGVMGMSPVVSLSLTVFAEVVCSLFILLGFATRLAAIPLIITMLIAVFYVHAEDSFADQELGLHYLLVYIVLLILGSGKYSLDSLLVREQNVNLKKT